jgi:hypothetical protein
VSPSAPPPMAFDAKMRLARRQPLHAKARALPGRDNLTATLLPNLL